MEPIDIGFDEIEQALRESAVYHERAERSRRVREELDLTDLKPTGLTYQGKEIFTSEAVPKDEVWGLDFDQIKTKEWELEHRIEKLVIERLTGAGKRRLELHLRAVRAFKVHQKRMVEDAIQVLRVLEPSSEMPGREVSEVSGWLEEGRQKGARKLFVCMDTFDYDIYPVFLMPDEDFQKTFKRYWQTNMQTIMEIYDLSLPLNEQPRQHLGRAWAYEKEEK